MSSLCLPSPSLCSGSLSVSLADGHLASNAPDFPAFLAQTTGFTFTAEVKKEAADGHVTSNAPLLNASSDGGCGKRREGTGR